MNNTPKFPIPWYKKINPIFWFGNYDDPISGPESHPYFHPDKALWHRRLLWAIRNPLHNLFFFVIGFEDRKDIVNFNDQWPKEGQKFNIILPFISYRGKKREWYLGWRRGLRFGAAFRKSNSKPM